jgi:plasmid stability protein
MPAVTVRNLSDETHRALNSLASKHGRSTEAEIRHILETAVKPSATDGLGSKLAAIGRRAKVDDRDLEFERDRTPAEPIPLE